MKRITALLLAAVIALSLTACCGKNNSGNAENEQSTAQNIGNNSSTGNHQAPNKPIVYDGSKLGVLQPIAEQQDFVINGLYISSESGQHEYENVESVDAYGTEGLNSEFELNEWIGFYVDTRSKAPWNIYIVRNDAQADYSEITVQELESICSDKGYPVIADAAPDAQNYGKVGQAYVNPESSQPDLFNAFFTTNGKVCYMVQLNIIAEDSAE